MPSAIRRSVRLALICVLALLAIAATAPTSHAATYDATGFTGWGVTRASVATATTVPAFSYDATTKSWKNTTRPANAWVWTSPYATGWVWTWTSDRGWLAMQSTLVAPGTNERFHATQTDSFVRLDGSVAQLRGVNVRDVVVNDANGRPTWTFSRDRFATIKTAGYDHVRFTLNWNTFEPTRGQFNTTALATLDTAVANAKAAGLHIIMDPLHLKQSDRLGNVPGWAKSTGTDSLAVVQNSGRPYLRLIAQRYANEPAVIAIDLVNEVKTKTGLDNARLLGLYNALIAEVRAVDHDKPIILESLGGDVSIQNFDFARISNKSNVIWSFHLYFAGGEEDGYSASGWVTGHEVWDGTSGYPTRNAAQIKRHVEVNVIKLRSVGIPLYIGEFGIGMNATNRDLWIQDAVAAFRAFRLPYTYWEWHSNGSMSITNSDYTFRPWSKYITG